jgi:hypothetical protein
MNRLWKSCEYQWTIASTSQISMGKDRPLSYLLDQTGRFQATDLRDNVFALGGLCNSLKITPDYNLTVAEVFIDTAGALIKNSLKLDVLW